MLLLTFTCCYAQQRNNPFSISDTLNVKYKAERRHELYKAIRLPVTFIALGTVITLDGDDLINKYEIREERQESLGSFHTSIDNYLQYAPIALTYGLNVAGVKSQHDFANRTALLIKSELIMVAITYPLKQLSAVARPDTGQRNSFPSGHTAQAFAAATFMHKEYGKKNIWFSVLGYGMATGVGLMRMANNRHWASDVIAGAGIGILSTNLAYLTHQNKWGSSKHRAIPGKQKNQLVFTPSYQQQAIGFSSVLFIR